MPCFCFDVQHLRMNLAHVENSFMTKSVQKVESLSCLTIQHVHNLTVYRLKFKKRRVTVRFSVYLFRSVYTVGNLGINVLDGLGYKWIDETSKFLIIFDFQSAFRAGCE